MAVIEQAEEEARRKKEATGVKFGQMSVELAAKKEEAFTFARLNETRPEVWANIAAFYGIREDFPSDFLFYQKNTKNNLVFISEGLANGLMKCTRKYKLNVVNLGVKMFSKNRDDKSSA
jgi:hypothetical protein